jgi:hypothetical protein
MQKYMDTVLVGVVTLIVVVIVLIGKPFYTPVEVTDDALALVAGEITVDGEPFEGLDAAHGGEAEDEAEAADSE